jgi:hypothetical protein
MKMAGHAADNDRQRSAGDDWALNHGHSSGVGRERERCAALWSINFQLVLSSGDLVENPLSFLKFGGRLIVESYSSRADVRRQFQR